MRTALTVTVVLASLVKPTPARAVCSSEPLGNHSVVCYGKARHISCARGLPTDLDTAPGCHFDSRAPDFSFYTQDGRFHQRFGNCDVSCQP